jgi:integral membrane sensor domain MASE1
MVRIVVLVAAGYAAGSLSAFALLEASSAGAVFFPGAGVSLAALVLTRRRTWPLVLATVATTETVIDMAHGQSLPVALGFAAANTVEPLVSALLLRGVVGTVDLTRRRDLASFVGAAVVVGPMVGALIGATTIAVGLGRSWLDAFFPFWAGDALGVLTVAGAILTCLGRPGHGVGLPRLLLWPMVLTAVVTVLAFWPNAVPLAYLPMPLLLWLAFRHGVAVVAVAGFTMTLTANVMTAFGRGPWASLAETPNAEVATLQLFLAVTILAAWLLAVEISERERAAELYEKEHEAAHQLQRALLPVVPKRLPGVEIATLYRAADAEQEVGGDWYDVFALRHERVGIVVGDIVGHELQAAVAMGRLHAALRVSAATSHDGPAEVLSSLDRACQAIPDACSSTVGYAEYDPRSGRLRYACAGHPPPLLVHRGEPLFLPHGRSTPLGVDGGSRTEGWITVPEGSTLLWYSDGLVERRDADIDVGLARLARASRSMQPTADPQAWVDALIDSLTGGRHMEDDVVLVCLRLSRVTDQPPWVSAERNSV